MTSAQTSGISPSDTWLVVQVHEPDVAQPLLDLGYVATVTDLTERPGDIGSRDQVITLPAGQKTGYKVSVSPGTYQVRVVMPSGELRQAIRTVTAGQHAVVALDGPPRSPSRKSAGFKHIAPVIGAIGAVVVAGWIGLHTLQPVPLSTEAIGESTVEMAPAEGVTADMASAIAAATEKNTAQVTLPPEVIGQMAASYSSVDTTGSQPDSPARAPATSTAYVKKLEPSDGTGKVWQSIIANKDKAEPDLSYANASPSAPALAEAVPALDGQMDTATAPGSIAADARAFDLPVTAEGTDAAALPGSTPQAGAPTAYASHDGPVFQWLIAGISFALVALSGLYALSIFRRRRILHRGLDVVLPTAIAIAAGGASVWLESNSAGWVSRALLLTAAASLPLFLAFGGRWLQERSSSALDDTDILLASVLVGAAASPAQSGRQQTQDILLRSAPADARPTSKGLTAPRRPARRRDHRQAYMIAITNRDEGQRDDWRLVQSLTTGNGLSGSLTPDGLLAFGAAALSLPDSDKGSDTSIFRFDGKEAPEPGLASTFILSTVSNTGGDLMILPLPWRCRTGHATIEVRSAKQANVRSRLSVAIQDPDFGRLLAYLSSGLLVEASVLAREAMPLLSDKDYNPYAMAAAGYVLLSDTTQPFHADDAWRRQIRALYETYTWLPDGAILQAWSLLQHQEADDADRARRLLLEAVDRGLPVFTEGLRRLSDGLNLFRLKPKVAGVKGREVDEEVAAALALVEPTITRCNPRQPLTSLRLGD